MRGEGRWALLVFAAACLSFAVAQRDQVTGPGAYPSGTLRLPRSMEATPPDAALVPYFRVPVAGEVGAVYWETSYVISLAPDGSRLGSRIAGPEVVLTPGRYAVETRACAFDWQWVHDEDRYGHSPFSGRPLGAIVKIEQPVTCVQVSYTIEVFDDDALKETCPSWHTADVERGLDSYRDTLFHRHNVRTGLDLAQEALAFCAARNWSRHHTYCRAARARIRWTEAGVDAYVDDCERLLDVLEQPGNWDRLQGCLLDLGLPTVAEQIERQCASPEEVCTRLHQNLMRLIGSASDSAQAYRHLPECLRFLYPRPKLLEDWYTGGRPLDF